MSQLTLPADVDPAVRARRRQIGALIATTPARPRPVWWITRGYSAAPRAAQRTTDVVHRGPCCPVSDLNVPWRLVDAWGVDVALDELKIRPWMRVCGYCFTRQETEVMGTELAYYTPPPSSLDAKMLYAQAIAKSPSAPEKLRGQPETVLLILDLGESLMIRPGVAFMHISAANGLPSPDAHLTNALVRRAGHDLTITEGVNNQGVPFCTVSIRRRDKPRSSPPHTVTWTLDDAAAANLTAKDVWKKYPRVMLKRRAVVECVRDECPEVLMGMDVSRLLDDDLADTELIGAEATADGADAIVDAELVDEPAPVDPELSAARDEVSVLADTLGLTNAQRKQAFHNMTEGGDLSLANVTQLTAFASLLDQQLKAAAAKQQAVS